MPPGMRNAPAPGAEPDDAAPHETVGDEEGSLPPHPLLQRSPFAHPEWAVGMVLVMGGVFLVLGLFGHPIWLLLGGPFVLTLVVWFVVRVVLRRS